MKLKVNCGVDEDKPVCRHNFSRGAIFSVGTQQSKAGRHGRQEKTTKNKMIANSGH